MESSWHRGISASMFGFVVAFFFLPFVTVSCAEEFAEPMGIREGGDEKTLSGIDLVTGTEASREIEDPMTGEPMREETELRIPSEPFAIVAFGLAIAGMGTVLIRRKGPVKAVAFWIAFAGSGSLVLLGLSPTLRGLGFNQADIEIGYWLAMAAFGAAAVWNAVLIRRSRAIPAPPEPAAASPPP